MTERQNWLLRCDFTDASAPTDCATLYSGASCPATGTRTAGGGFEGVNAGAEQGTTIGSGGAPSDRRSHPSDDQFSRVEFASVLSGFSPGALVRCNAGASDDFGCSGTSHAGTTEIYEHTAGSYTQLGTGSGATPVIGSTIYCQAEGTTIEAGVNEGSDVSLTSGLHASGDPGFYSFVGAAGSALGDEWEAGDLATLTDVVIAGDSAEGFPLELAAGKTFGTYIGQVIDLGSEAKRWWSVAVDSYEQETVTAAELPGVLVGSGEYRWRSALGREASQGFPGADFEIRNDEPIKNDDDGFTGRGRKGVIGAHTRAKVSVRFYVGGDWEGWIAGAWVGEKTAEKIQVKVDLDRRELKYQRRVRRIEVAHAA